MKIPETPANVGAYYGNEENGQWQPNGVILDSGIGSGDAGVHRTPVYPVHIPRGHIPSYVMAGAYYPPAYPAGPPPQDDFADYMWMENEDEFDKQVMQQLEEEALMEQCIEAMLEDEQRERQRPTANGHNHYPTSSNGGTSISLEEAVSRSTLNPLAAEFVPSFGARQTVTEEKTEPAETKTEGTESKEESHTQSETAASLENKEQSRTEEPIPASTDPPEVSAADVQPIDDKKVAKKDAKKQEAKKPVKPEAKAKTKAVVARVETKPQKKKEVKAKSETEEEVAPAEDTTASPVEESTPAFKPINYAAAAKANKPKKPTTPPATDKTAPPPKLDVKPKAEKTDKKPLPKDKVKTDKPPAPQRKNSAK
ncbi:microtubule-associated protein 1B [Aricia agestis]|uniref:microtubule-associated protein 1B n=1 Tax=Aricia agestis TaxID=91739 RepID=UPI001C209914|nr:microtubule-associated protein 1B [Aricia agestis]